MSRSLEDLVARWERIAKHAATYNLTLDDWLNDLDLRDMIGRQLVETSAANAADIRSRLAFADKTFREATLDAKQSLWGPTAGGEHHPTRHWWYFRYPSAPGAAIRRDLETAGILARSER